ncbi:cryptococcal mannosyltransferase 1-domain-containing protein [Vararia minispora EC-137]|uniref:Cryptococcal mannosyltransferase 1-domain-containing protein n=1 Tax=Vararia minispora EC-137 TaxID=1314806 RepID=A0ACB8Q5V4_9AGAM|nr:cryptococcal mannosyltransferase 1-domain-containing protein [Vararia minispora EC-137]
MNLGLSGSGARRRSSLGLPLPMSLGLPARAPPRLARLALGALVLLVLGALYILLTPYAPVPSRASARALQRTAFRRTAHHRRVRCTYSDAHWRRYRGLKAGRRVFLAVNLFESEAVVGMFFQELPGVIEALGGGENVYVSVYENGSGDRTPEMLDLFDKLLTALQVPHTVVSKGAAERSDKEEGKRILVLAAARNLAMEPLYLGAAAAALGGEPDEVLFMNDIFFCAADVLEVVYQKRRQGMHQACALDWDPGQIAYDRWVLRSMSGRNWYRTPELVDWFNGPNDHPKSVPFALQDDLADRVRFEAHLPLQVFSCWNGASVIDASAFLPPRNMRFRQSRADMDEHLGVPKNATMKASECFLSSVDLWKMGFGRIGIVPKASVAYTADLYDRWRKDGLELLPEVAVHEWINWRADPPTQVAFQDYAWWWVPDRWGPWDEQ